MEKFIQAIEEPSDVSFQLLKYLYPFMTG